MVHGRKDSKHTGIVCILRPRTVWNRFFYLEKSRVDWTRTNLTDRLEICKDNSWNKKLSPDCALRQNMIGAKRVTEDREFVLTSVLLLPQQTYLAHLT